MNNLKSRREGMGLSQTRLAVMAGVSNSTVSEIEKGHRTPWPRLRRALAKALGTTEAELFPTDKEGSDGK